MIVFETIGASSILAGDAKMEIHNEKKENLARFIERTLLGWPEGLRVYHINGRTYQCYESDEQWEKHLAKIDMSL